MHNHERLDVWRRAHSLSVEVCVLIGRTRSRSHRAVIAQFERAVISIPANIAEGAGQSTDPQFARYLDVAAASAQEAQSHLSLITDLKVLPRANYAAWRGELIALRRMAQGLARRVRDPSTPREP